MICFCLEGIQDPLASADPAVLRARRLARAAAAVELQRLLTEHADDGDLAVRFDRRMMAAGVGLA